MATRRLQVTIQGDVRGEQHLVTAIVDEINKRTRVRGRAPIRTASDHWLHGWAYRIHWLTRWGR